MRTGGPQTIRCDHMEEPGRQCIAVLGPGRSGTSLAMKLLQSTGMRLSTTLVGPSDDNPDGHFEDAQIAHTQQALIASLELSPYRPRPDIWMQADRIGQTRNDLAAVVSAEVGRDDQVWGFKDPRTCLTWPLWVEVFEQTSVQPRPVFCAREAAIVVRSLMHSYSLPQDVAEGLYLYRILHALEDVHEPWFFVHYQSWFDDPSRQLGELAAFCGLNADDGRIDEIVAANFRPELNRRSADSGIAVSGVLLEADRLLEGCTGTDYDAGEIAGWCASVRSRVDDLGFLQYALDRHQRTTTSPISRTMRRAGSRAKRRIEKLVRTDS